MVFSKYSNKSSSNSNGNSKGGISFFFGVSGSGKGSADESWLFAERVGDSSCGGSSGLDSSSTGRGSMKKVFSEIWSNKAYPSEVVLNAKDPPVEMSSCRADSLLSPNQKC